MVSHNLCDNLCDNKKTGALDTASWSELLGNKYRYSLHPYMLLPNGYNHATQANLKGNSKYSVAKQTVIINFDESYVIAYIVTIILTKLRPASYNDFQKIISKCWKEYQQQVTNGK